MVDFLREHLLHHFHHPNYLFFMIILIMIIVLPPFALLMDAGIFLIEVLFGLVILTGALYASSTTTQLIISLAWGGIGFLFFVINRDQDRALGLLNALFIFSFFLFILWKIVGYVLRTKEVNANSIFACISGYLVLGLSAAPLFLMINRLLPKAFTVTAEANFFEFLYFSFITLTSIGYGDITPIHPVAKSLTLLIGITGQLYLTFLVAIIIGKYLFNQ